MDAGSRASLKSAVTTVDMLTAVAPEDGVVPDTAGGVTSVVDPVLNWTST